MKKTWEEPIILVQKFIPNEYVAACGDSGVVYNFVCNAGRRGREYAVYTLESGEKKFLKVNGHTVNGRDWYYHPCNETHSAESDSGFLTGYYIDDLDTKRDEQVEVIVWTENGTDVHCTKDLDMDSWTTAKS